MADLSKKARQQLILTILKEGGAATQDEIRAALGRRGVDASQVTVSRDLTELGVAKLTGGHGRRYGLPGAEAGKAAAEANLRRALREHALSMEAVGAFLVLKTPPSGAPALAFAIDQAALPGLAGTIAGDDTIFALLRDPSQGAAVLARLQSLSA